jgi:hypothetical protein
MMTKISSVMRGGGQAHKRQDDAEYQQAPETDQRDSAANDKCLVQHVGRHVKLHGMYQAAQKLPEQTGHEKTQGIDDAAALFFMEVEQQEHQPQRHQEHQQ